jgi:predicted DNA-binding transcriptional regulator AlpA
MDEEGKKKNELKENPRQLDLGLMRIKDVLQFVPISRSCWWAGVKSHRFPQPVKLSARVTCWRAQDIRALIEGIQ